jgi:mRNA interferase MazF
MRRFEIWLVGLDPTMGQEIKKTRPCVIISPDEVMALSTVIVAPLTSKGFSFPGRVPTTFDGKQGLILLDQLRAVDKKRLHRRLGELDAETCQTLCARLQEYFMC